MLNQLLDLYLNSPNSILLLIPAIVVVGVFLIPARTSY